MEREITARIKIRFQNGTLDVKSKNTLSIFEEITIVSKAITMLGSDKHSNLSSYEYNYFDGEDGSICLAMNIETLELQITVSDIHETMILGLLEYAKHVIVHDLLGDY